MSKRASAQETLERAQQREYTPAEGHAWRILSGVGKVALTALPPHKEGAKPIYHVTFVPVNGRVQRLPLAAAYAVLDAGDLDDDGCAWKVDDPGDGTDPDAQEPQEPQE